MRHLKCLMVCVAIGIYFGVRWYSGADWSTGILRSGGTLELQLLGLFESVLIAISTILLIFLHFKGKYEIDEIERIGEMSFSFFPMTIFIAVKSDYIDRDLDRAKNET